MAEKGAMMADDADRDELLRMPDLPAPRSVCPFCGRGMSEKSCEEWRRTCDGKNQEFLEKLAVPDAR